VTRWRVLWRVITNSRRSIVAVTVLVFGTVVVVELVMAHGYRVGVQWGPDRHLELAPASSATAVSIVQTR
jgi:hypothetical protein